MNFGKSREHREFAALSRRSALGLGLAAVPIVAMAACGDSEDGGATAPSVGAADADAMSIATDAYVFGYPLVLMDVTRENGAPANRFQHGDPPTPENEQVVRLNLDTLYSQAWLDVRTEPMILRVPAMEPARYWLMQIMDAWSNTVHDPSSLDPQVTPGSAAPPFTYAVTGPGWSGPLPDGVTQLAVPTGTAWLIGRLQFDGAADVDRVRELQRQLELVPLSEWVEDPNAAHGDPGAEPAAAAYPAGIVAEMDGPTFFDRMGKVMALNPAAPADADAMRRFATIGIVPGASPTDVPADVLNAAAAEAKKRIPAYRNPNAEDLNGWNFDPSIGAYGTDYDLRAIVAMQGLGANLAKDAIYPTVHAVADDDGVSRRFRIRFAAGQLPPVNAFWSLTAYDADSHFVDNPAGIYALGHQTAVVPGADGSVQLAVQSDDPGTGVPQGNWLPIPATGAFSLTMRLYAPKSEAVDGTWRMPKLEQID
ncbi:DUF1254 domain-containing protein [Nocardia lijiangensis]|uniref:DUF1254 domain-containing protein n=1 Tax=Nocardia lijiangensis TaxID=299618 RepID=UPI00082A5D1D|nr:DUF1254 domain-containing protein [Nocardia lijiangensis]